MDENRIYTELKTIGERLTVHTTILNEVIKPDIEEIKTRVGIQNGRVAVLEKRVDARDIICGVVQDGKKKLSVNLRWVLGISIPTILTCIGLFFAAQRYLPNKSKPMLIFEKIDSTHIKMAPLIMRGDSGYTIDTINAVYLNISNLDEL